MYHLEIVLTIILVWCHLVMIDGYASGAPITACITMKPGHGQETGSTPYSLNIGGATSYSPGKTVSVIITGGNYEGLMLQARRKQGSTVPVGTFSVFPANTRVMNCGNDADTVTHNSINPKNANSVYTWTAPDQDVGTINFVATIAQVKTTWWKDHVSSELSFSSGQQVVSTETSREETSTPTSISPSISTSTQNTSDNGGDSVKCSIFVMWTTITLSLFGNRWQ